MEIAGGGIHNAGQVTLSNATVSGNTALTGGGAFNYSGALTLQRTLLAGNHAPTGPEARRLGGAVVVGARNVFGFGGDAGLSGLSPGAGDMVPAVALAAVLSPLAANGGPTQTHALPSFSPAIDRAPSAACAAAPISGVDQRGQPRNIDGNGIPSANECDIGAFEAPPGSAPGEYRALAPLILRP